MLVFTRKYENCFINENFRNAELYRLFVRYIKEITQKNQENKTGFVHLFYGL